MSNRSIWSLLTAAAAVSAGNGVVFALLAEVQRVHGFETSALGWISGAFFASSLVGLLTLAHLADSGRGFQLLIGGLVVSAIALWWFAVATELWQFVAARALGGMAYSAFMAAARAAAARIDPTAAGHNLGRVGAADIGGFVLGPVLGTWANEVGGLAAPFWALGGIAAIAAAWLALSGSAASAHAPTTPTDGADTDAQRRWLTLSGLDLLADRRILAAAMLALALYLPVGVYDSMWARYLTDLGASARFVGTSLTLYGLPIVLLAARGGRLVDRIGPIRAMSIAMIGVVPITALYGILGSAWLVAGIALVEAVFQAVASPASQTAMARVCPPHRTAAGQGLGAVLGLAGAGLVGSVAPTLYGATSSTVVFGGVAAACAVIFFVARALYGPDGGGAPAEVLSPS